MQFTTLVPAYKPKYLMDLLTCLRHQTVKPAKVIFSDDSPDQAFVAMLTTESVSSLVADLNISVVAGPRTGGYNNFRHLLNLYNSDINQRTELFHLLLDDDVIYPSFYERHLEAHQCAKLPCVISRRWSASESGHPLRDDLPVPSIVSNNINRMLSIEAETLFAQTVGSCKNWLGEFSNATFRAEMATELDDASIAGISFHGLEDLGGFLKASMHGPIGYIQDYLGYFRTSAQQNSANPMGRPLKLAFLAYISLTIAGRRLNYLSQAQSAEAIKLTSLFILQHYQAEDDMRDMCELMKLMSVNASETEDDFLRLWQIYSSSSHSLLKKNDQKICQPSEFQGQ